MQTKQELLKIYSAYLPYDLKLQHLYQKAKHKPETTLRSWVKPLEPLDLGCLFPHRKDSFDWKPILYSMDMLTKEIEHKGERFIPIEKLSEIFNFDFDGDGFQITEDLTIVYHSYSETEGFIFPSNFWLDFYQKLFEWNFNVFGLEESEYIKKENLKTESND